MIVLFAHLKPTEMLLIHPYLYSPYYPLCLTDGFLKVVRAPFKDPIDVQFTVCIRKSHATIPFLQWQDVEIEFLC